MIYESIPTNKSLTVLGDSIYEEMLIKHQEKELLHRKKQVEDEVEGMKGKIARMDKELREANAYLIESLMELEKELVDLVSCKVDEAEAAHNEQARPNFDWGNNQRFDKEKVNTSSVSKDLKEKCKKIYRKIARKTHPDATGNDPYLEMIFKEARKLYVAGNLKGLTDLWESISTKRKLAHLRNMLKELEDSIRALENEKEQILKCEAWVMAVDFYDKGQAFKPRVEQHFRTLLCRKIDSLTRQISRIKNPPAPNTLTWGNFPGTGSIFWR